jgi:hypothetical protein
MITTIMKSMPWSKTPPPLPAAGDDPAQGDLNDPAVLDAIIAANRATINKCWDELDRLTLVLQMLNAREAQLNARSGQAPGGTTAKLNSRVNLSRSAPRLSPPDHKGGSTFGAKNA